ncbi:GNAT family N-acetyltransferase [Caballeronia sp. LP003]|uniref:GNAT family N-acetyltransferase n=1 Tax=Caballeronia sp. LP003 TaxID=3038551 RepID=UPI00285FE35B|nr:GNAT family N-acetyltransferase [Caballeronia sp. LP003]MDR5791695.1 GNAT family N-acetyltransferase [Caballeronia sp. LP003]
MKTFARILRSAVLNRPQVRNSARARFDVSYSQPIGNAELFIIKACGGRYGNEIGRVVAEPFEPTNCCYIMDVVVHPQHRKYGIARELLRRALQHSGQETLVPVSIERDAIAFWAHMALKDDLRVRLGLLNAEILAIRHAMGRT